MPTNVLHATANASANAAVVLTPAAGEYATINWIFFSYAANPTAGQLIVTDVTSNTQYFQATVISPVYGDKHDFLQFQPAGMSFEIGHQIQVTLVGTNSTKTLSVGFR